MNQGNINITLGSVEELKNKLPEHLHFPVLSAIVVQAVTELCEMDDGLAEYALECAQKNKNNKDMKLRHIAEMVELCMECKQKIDGLVYKHNQETNAHNGGFSIN